MKNKQNLFYILFFLLFMSCDKGKKFTKDEIRSLDPNGVYLSIEDAQKLKFNKSNSDSISPLKENSLNNGYFYILRFDSLSQKFVKQGLINPKYQTERQMFYINNDTIKINQDIEFIVSGNIPKEIKVYSSEDNYKSTFDTLKRTNNRNVLILTKKCKVKGVYTLIAKIKIDSEFHESKYKYCVF